MYLQLKRLSKYFGRTAAIRDFSLHMARGELVSLLGPSGCGKTTTLRMVGGFLRPDEGNIFLEGEDITSLPPERRPTATVFQSYALFPHMTVFQNVVYGLKFRRIDRKKALSMGMEMLEKTGLSGYASKNINQLSGGEQQRVALARSLITEPKVLLLDEPLSNLDARLRIRMRSEIRRIQRQLGITALYVTHDQEEALALSDRVAVMEGGRIAQMGTPREIYASASNSFVADFIGRSNILTLPDGKTVAVHPEDMKVASEGDGMDGVVLDRHFKGAVTTYFVRVKDNVFEADIFSKNDPEWKEGDRVTLSYREQDGMAL